MGTMRNYLRHIRTTQERRQWFGVEDVQLRARRSPAMLPTYFDDIWRRTQKSWKEHRRLKWRRISSP
jgi:hypothetical protein